MVEMKKIVRKYTSTTYIKIIRSLAYIIFNKNNFLLRIIGFKIGHSKYLIKK